MSSTPAKSPVVLPEGRNTGDIYDALILPPEGHCFHCGEINPQKPFVTLVLGEQRQMCCLGCQLAAQSIVEAGLVQYYLDRSEINRTAALPSQLTQLSAYDNEQIQTQFVLSDGAFSQAELSISNLRCAACTWLIERRLYEMTGVQQVQVNLTNQRMWIKWQDNTIKFSTIVTTIQSLGYDAKPFRQDTHAAMLTKQNRALLLRLVVAALGAMQAMMFAVALYFGEYTGMSLDNRDYLRWVSLFVSIPIIGYVSLPFYQSAWSALKSRQVNMDVPVSIALLVTFVASSYATIVGTGETYFDSIAMFVFFLLAGRYVEHTARVRASNRAVGLLVVEPHVYRRWQGSDEFAVTDDETALSQYLQDSPSQQWQEVTQADIQVGDIVQVDAGNSLPCDGWLMDTSAQVSQSLLTGESDLITKQQGDPLYGGSQTESRPLIMKISKLPQHSQLGVIDQLINRALAEKPKIAERADYWARWFVWRVLILSVLVFIGWYLVSPQDAIWATVAVLVATCPCALSLATPIALTVATNRLADLGFLVTRGHTLETLTQIDTVCFDKTGTLTQGQPKLIATKPQPDSLMYASTILDVATDDQQRLIEGLLSIAAALESQSNHPLAKGIQIAATPLQLPEAKHLEHQAGGVSGTVNQVSYRLGHEAFARDISTQHTPTDSNDYIDSNRRVVLSAYIDETITTDLSNTDYIASNDQPHWAVLAHFVFEDSIREDAQRVIATLREQGLATIMLTGDNSDHALQVQRTLQMDGYYAGMTPDDKVTYIQQQQSQQHKVMMIGDGINDAPVLAVADVSIAMSDAADIAQVASDSILLNSHLTTVLTAITIANKTQQIIQQNFRWAIGYNALILLPAIFGYVPPWLAAIGMSLSSIVVIINALRLSKAK